MLRNLTSFGRCANIARPLAMPAVSRPVIFARYASNEAIRHNRGFRGAPVEQPADDLYDIREKPQSLSYFTGNYKYNDLLIDLAELHKRYADWQGDDTVDQTVETSAWKLREKMEQMLAIPLKTSQWRKIVHHLNALAALPKPLPEAVERALQPYKRYDVNATGAGQFSTGVKALDDLGRAYAAGRRKESSARCWVVEGDGQILVNGMPLNNYFQRPIDRDHVTLPLEATQSLEKYNVWTIVNGGGSTGQAEAIKLGIGRALLIHDPELKPLLRQAGCITRDPRVVERKKEGQRKARARYTWVKR
ncbi:hypothetical protein K492DRAFT_152512 [Lichtheimia hyalospora FSU 10163]|nr:hypothetical protein K492DRAFT_152512 [Lichtheimia hyalospora FSU 10163]